MSGSRRLFVIVTVVVALLLAAAGLIYLTVQCQHIPAPLPGREAGSTKHRIGFAVVAFIVAGVVGGVALYAARPRPSSS